MDTLASLDDPRFDASFGAELNGHGPVYFPDPIVDNLMDALLAMAAALWETKDRLHHLEATLAEEGIDVSGRIEARATALADPQRRAECDAYVTSLFGAFLRRTGPPGQPQTEAAP
jgi:hypothetical protein